jgi:hypothetical protein
VKNLPIVLAGIGAISAIAFGFGWQCGRSTGAIQIFLGLMALAACLWIAFFGYYGWGVSVGVERWIVLALGFLPLVALVVGFLSGRH